MRWQLAVLVVVACGMTGCGMSASAPVVPTSIPHPSASPTTRGPAVTLRATAKPKRTPVPDPIAIYSQEHVGEGEYQLINNFTNQFESVRARGVRTVCTGGAACKDYLLIGVTEYSGNTQASVSPRAFILVSAVGARFAPASARRAARVVQPRSLLRTTVLQPDDDGDFASGKLVFVVPRRAGRFSLTWHGYHVATFVKTAKNKLFETR